MKILKSKKIKLLVSLLLIAVLIAAALKIRAVIKKNRESKNLKQKILTDQGNRFLVKRSDIKLEININGTIEPLNSTKLKFSKEGVVTDVYVKKGDFIKKDSLIAALDSTEVNYQLMEGKKELEKTKITGSPIDVRIKKAKLKLDQRNVAYTKLIAPHDGVIVEWEVEENNHVKPEKEAGVLYDLTAYKATVKVNENDISHISEGNQVTVTFNAVPGYQLIGRVDSISPVYKNEQGITTYPVLIQFDRHEENFKPIAETNQDLSEQGRRKNRILPGFSFRGKIVYEKRENAILIPKLAAAQDKQGFYVAKLNQDTLKKKYIKIDHETTDYYEVTQGLDTGDTILKINPIDLIETENSEQE